METQQFHPGEIVQHFKRELEKEPGTRYLYRILGTAEHTESGERLMIYRALYGDGGIYARPMSMFLSEVDRERYPHISQRRRFTRFEGPAPLQLASADGSREETLTYPSADGKTSIHATAWIPETEPRGVVQISHGMAEHIERYAPFARYLAALGYAVVGNDHLGHGRSICCEEDLGYFLESGDPSAALLEDMHSLRCIAQFRWPGKPYIMIGHSLGSFLLRSYLVGHGTGLCGAILLGTGWIPHVTCAAGIQILHQLALVKGWRYRSKQADQLIFNGDYKRFDLTGQDPARSWLTHDEEMVKAYYSDPRCHFQFTLNGYLGLLKAVDAACSERNICLVPKTLPLLIASGGNDPVGGMGKGVRATCDAYQKAGIRDVTLSLYEGDLHEILNEKDREKIWADLAGWIDTHCGA